MGSGGGIECVVGWKRGVSLVKFVFSIFIVLVIKVLLLSQKKCILKIFGQPIKRIL